MPAWTPESDTQLANLVSVFSLEESVMKLMAEFLAGWFNGGAHDVQTTADVTFPLAKLIFQQMPIDQPLEGLSIACLFVDKAKTRLTWDTDSSNQGARHARIPAQLDFIIRAFVKDRRADGHTSHSLVRLGADMLYGLLIHKALTMPLSRCGLQEIVPDPHQLVPTETHPTRRMRCRIKLHFPLLEAVVVGGGGEIIGTP